jgi:predicted nucleotidyltransferase component of viral defense system
MASSHSLSPFQTEVLRAFFAREQGFFLTGGAALVGYHLGHRTTNDLDLFSTDDAAWERSAGVLAEAAASLGAELSVKQDYPGFRRVVLQRAQQAVVVDLVRDRVPPLLPKEVREGVRVDSAAEILANKLTTLLGRAEERDLVDVYCLESAGYSIESALAGALKKDGGCTPAALAWLLSEVRIPDEVALPAGVAASELRDWLAGLVVRLRRLALP